MDSLAATAGIEKLPKTFQNQEVVPVVENQLKVMVPGSSFSNCLSSYVDFCLDWGVRSKWSRPHLGLHTSLYKVWPTLALSDRTIKIKLQDPAATHSTDVELPFQSHVGQGPNLTSVPSIWKCAHNFMSLCGFKAAVIFLQPRPHTHMLTFNCSGMQEVVVLASPCTQTNQKSHCFVGELF